MATARRWEPHGPCLALQMPWAIPTCTALEHNCTDPPLVPMLYQVTTHHGQEAMTDTSNGWENTHEDLAALDHALFQLYAATSHFAAAAIHDSRMRAQYQRDVGEMARELKAAVDTGQLSARAAAEQAHAVRNSILEGMRAKTSPTVRAYATQLKRAGLTLSELEEKYAAERFQKRFSQLSPHQQNAVYGDIIDSAGRPRPRVMNQAKWLGRAGRRVMLVSFAIAVYEVAKADDKPLEMMRQGTLAGAGIAGGVAVGSAAVAFGLCAATAPVCVGVMALAGSMLAAYGADTAWGSIYQRTQR